MIGRATIGPLISKPQSWMLVFDRVAPTPFLDFVAFGRYKHVRAFGYVPFLHVWIFFDPHWTANDLFVAADGSPATDLMQNWIINSDVMRFRRLECNRPGPPLAGWCVPAIKRLIGLRSSALRPDSLWRDCLENGGEPIEADHGQSIRRND